MATSTYCLITALVLAAAMLARLWQRARAQSDLTGVVTLEAGAAVNAAIVGLVVGASQMALGVLLLGFDMWDLMSVVYYDVVVAVPLVGAGVLLGGFLHGRSPRFPMLTRPASVLAVLALVPAAVGWYATRIEPFALRVDEVVVAVDPARTGDEPLTVGVISDIQTVAVTGHERAAVAEVMAADPDIVLVAGDIFQGTEAQLAVQRDGLRELFASMRAPGGAYLVPGDVDRVAGLEELVAGTPVTVLANEVVTVPVGDRVVKVAGLGLEVTGAGLDVLDRMQSVPGEDLRVVLAHRPDWALRLEPASRIDLTVAGHTHGGQVQLPGIGPILTMSDAPRAVAAGGLHDLEENRVYVSTGVGREQQGAPQIRFLAPPSVAVVTLTG